MMKYFTTIEEVNVQKQRDQKRNVWRYFTKNNQTDVKEKFQPKNTDIDSSNAL